MTQAVVSHKMAELSEMGFEITLAHVQLICAIKRLVKIGQILILQSWDRHFLHIKRPENKWSV